MSLELEAEELWRRFTHHAPTGSQVTRYQEIRDMGAQLVQGFVDRCPASRELSLAVTSIEQGIMWANAAIARREAPVPAPAAAPGTEEPAPVPAPDALPPRPPAPAEAGLTQAPQL